MPSKRQPSKQRRAAQNRAKTQSLAARREHANQPAPARKPYTGGGGPAAAGATPRRPGLLGSLLGTSPGGRSGREPYTVPGNPGRVAIIAAVVLSLGAGMAILFFLDTPVDDRGEAVPLAFGGLFVRAREALTGGSIETTKESLLDAHGTAALIWAILPAVIALVALGVYQMRRSKGQTLYWPTTIAMVAMALVVMLVGASYAMPAMIALAVASFQVRKAEMPNRLAERAAAEEAAAADADAEAEDDEYEDDEYEDEDAEYEDDEYDEEDDDDVEYEDDDVIEVDEVEPDEGEGDVEEPEAPKKK